MEPGEILRKHRARIVDEWARMLRSWEDSGYARRSLEELLKTAGECFDGYLELIEADRRERIDAFIRDITRRRASLGFRLRDVLRAFRAFLPIAVKVLEEEGEMGLQWVLFEPVEYALASSSTQYGHVVESELLSTVQELAATIAANPGDLQACADAVVQSATRLTDSEYGYLDVPDVSGQRPTCSMVGLKPEERGLCRDPDEHMLGKGLFRRITASKRPLLTNDPAREPGSVGTPSDHPPIECFLGVPILSGDTVLGVISVANKPGGYAEEDRATLSTLANLAAPGIEAARLMKESGFSQDAPEDREGQS